MKQNNVGILASMSWNSNKWGKTATTEDIDNSNYDFVKENGWMHEDLNFATAKYPAENDGTFIAYTPMFNSLPSLEESKYVDIVFFRSLNYHTNTNCIVGFYAYPKIDAFNREADNPIYDKYDWGNVRSKIENIILFDNHIEISNELVAKNRDIPSGKKLGQQGFNYLLYENVVNILDAATQLNPANSRLKTIKLKFLTDIRYKQYK